MDGHGWKTKGGREVAGCKRRPRRRRRRILEDDFVVLLTVRQRPIVCSRSLGCSPRSARSHSSANAEPRQRLCLLRLTAVSSVERTGRMLIVACTTRSVPSLLRDQSSMIHQRHGRACSIPCSPSQAHRPKTELPSSVGLRRRTGSFSTQTAEPITTQVSFPITIISTRCPTTCPPTTKARITTMRFIASRPLPRLHRHLPRSLSTGRPSSIMQM